MQAAVVGKKVRLHAGKALHEIVDHLGDGAAARLDPRLTVGMGPKNRGKSNADGHLLLRVSGR